MSNSQFTKHDFNNLLNFGDVRAAEFYLEVDGEARESCEYVTPFASNLDVVNDYVSPKRIAKLLTDGTSYMMKVSRNYPFHEAFILDCVQLSIKSRMAYTPCVVAAKSTFIRIREEGCYARFFTGSLGERRNDQLVELHQGQFAISGATILVIYRPNDCVQREILMRSFRRAASKLEDPNRYSKSCRSDFATLVDSIMLRGVDSSVVEDEYFQSLLQFWPAGAYGRLSSFVLLHEGLEELIAEPVKWNLRFEGESLKDLRGETVQISDSIKQSLAGGAQGKRIEVPRTLETDALVAKGLFSYHRESDWRSRGRVELCSMSDPTVHVRTDGKRRWLAFAHGGIESIESLITGRNLATGGGFIQNEFLDLVRGGNVAFLGLGLGVIQRNWASQCEITSVEISKPIIEMYCALYAECSSHRIIHGDFFGWIHQSGCLWDAFVIDCFLPLDSHLQDSLKMLLVHLRAGGMLMLNKNGEADQFEAWVAQTAALLGSSYQIWSLDFDQSVALLRKGANSSTSITS